LIQLKNEKSLAKAGLFYFAIPISFLHSIASELFHLMKYFSLDTITINFSSMRQSDGKN